MKTQTNQSVIHSIRGTPQIFELLSNPCNYTAMDIFLYFKRFFHVLEYDALDIQREENKGSFFQSSIKTLL